MADIRPGVMPETGVLNRIRAHLAQFQPAWRQSTPFDWRATLACIIGGLLLWALVDRLPMLGYDWYTYFVEGELAYYPPWTAVVLKPLTALPWRQGLSLLNALLLMTIAVAAARESKLFSRSSMLGAALLAVLTPPVWMLMWQGTIDAVVLLGLVALPPGMWLVLIKPQVAAWGILARRGWMVVGVITVAISLLIWGWWPLEMVTALSHLVGHPIAMGWQVLGLPVLGVGILLLLCSNADPLRLMAAGSFLVPYLMQVHLIVLIPAIGRAQGRARLWLWAAAWLLILPPMFQTPWSKYLAMVFPLAVWWLLRPGAKPDKVSRGIEAESGEVKA